MSRKQQSTTGSYLFVYVSFYLGVSWDPVVFAFDKIRVPATFEYVTFCEAKSYGYKKYSKKMGEKSVHFP
jgi:hypothetical protein